MKNKLNFMIAFLFSVVILFTTENVKALDWTTESEASGEYDCYMNGGSWMGSYCDYGYYEPSYYTNLSIRFEDIKTGNYISDVTFGLYENWDIQGNCTGAAYDMSTWNQGDYLFVSVGEVTWGQNLCLKVTSVPELYSTPSEIVISSGEDAYHVVFLDRKISVDDTMANISLLVIAIGVIGLGVGGYLIYRNLQNKKTNDDIDSNKENGEFDEK